MKKSRFNSRPNNKEFRQLAISVGSNLGEKGIRPTKEKKINSEIQIEKKTEEWKKTEE